MAENSEAIPPQDNMQSPSNPEEQPFPAREGERWNEYMIRREKWLAGRPEGSPKEIAEEAHERRVGTMNELIDNAMQQAEGPPKLAAPKSTPKPPTQGPTK